MGRNTPRWAITDQPPAHLKHSDTERVGQLLLVYDESAAATSLDMNTGEGVQL